LKKYIILLIALYSLTLLGGEIEVVSLTPNRITIDFLVDDYTLVDEAGYSYFKSPGLGFEAEVGRPMLPQINYYIGVPANGIASVRVVESKITEQYLSKPLMPAPEVIQTEKGSELKYQINEAFYNERSLNTVQLLEPTYFRYNRVIPLLIIPVSYDYQRSKINITERLRIEIDIIGDTSVRQAQIDDLDLSSVILNYSEARFWQERETVEVEYAPFDKADFWYQFEVTENGMYELTSQQLKDLPLADLDPKTIRIFTTGGALLSESINDNGFPFKEIPILVEGEEDGRFDSGDKIIFYARNRDGFDQNSAISGSIAQYYNPYSGNGVYWLTFAGRFEDSPKRMKEKNLSGGDVISSSTPDYYHFESENVRRDHEGFTWFTSLMTGFSTSNHNYSFKLLDVDTTKQQRLKVALQADVLTSGSVTHRLSMQINGQMVMNQTAWSGVTYRSFTETGNFLQSGTNNLILTLHRTTSSNLYLDYYGIEYYRRLVKGGAPLYFNINKEDNGKNVEYRIEGQNERLRAYEVTDLYTVSTLPIKSLESPQMGKFRVIGNSGPKGVYAIIKEGEYFKPSNLKEMRPVDFIVDQKAVDALIIAPQAFLEEANKLAWLYKQNAGYEVLVADQQDIFNQFNGGMPDPNAIRLFVRHVFYNYPSPSGRRLKDVTLFGSGSLDWRNFSGQAAEKNKIIVFQRGTNTSEDFFVDLTGNNLPDLGVGRIAVQNHSHSDIFMKKLEKYWNDPTPGTWRNKLLFVADDEHTSSSDNESIHSVQVEDTSQLMSPAVIVDKLYCFEYPFDSLGNKPQARNAMVDAVNDGRLVWYYVGHGAYDLLGHESYFRPPDLQLLLNGDKLPLFIAASCDVAKYDYFSYSSLSERLLWLPNGGSIASLAATRLSSPGPNGSLMEQFLKRIINEHKRPGIALMQAKQMFASQSHNNRRYSYLGDPVLPINVPQSSGVVSIKGDPDSLFAYQKVDIEGTFSPVEMNGIAEFSPYASESNHTYTVQSNQYAIKYSKHGIPFHRGQSEVTLGDYATSFIVPGDVKSGDKGKFISYIYDEETKKDYVNYVYPLKLSNIAYAEAEPDTIPPTINVWLDSENFRNGDTISTNPTKLYARISDDSGINILGELGHKILLIFDELTTPVDITDHFVYDVDSYTTGSLNFEMKDLAEGEHSLQLIAFDNYNNPGIEKIHFFVSRKKGLVIDRMLPYPNPIKDKGYFTFSLSEDAEIQITIYTVTGKKIRTIRHNGISGYNQVFWDGRDQDGSKIANNTYLYKIRAVQLGSKKSVEKTGKVIILR